MGRLVGATVVVVVIIFAVPILVYGSAVRLGRLETPEGSGRFLVSVLVQKIGTAVAFVALFHLSNGAFDERWLLYAGIWFAAFTIGEVGQAIGPDYSVTEAVAGVISEAVYFPASAWVVAALLG